MSWPEPPPPQQFTLRLFVTGTTSRSRRAITAIKSICEEELAGQCTLEVIDIYQDPEATRDFQIVATPTLVKVAPAPLRKIIGDLSDRAKVLSGLNLLATQDPDSTR
jgi:circadian clock protein KaiB